MGQKVSRIIWMASNHLNILQYLVSPPCFFRWSSFSLCSCHCWMLLTTSQNSLASFSSSKSSKGTSLDTSETRSGFEDSNVSSSSVVGSEKSPRSSSDVFSLERRVTCCITEVVAAVVVIVVDAVDVKEPSCGLLGIWLLVWFASSWMADTRLGPTWKSWHSPTTRPEREYKNII